jgi:hypothetical protein
MKQLRMIAATAALALACLTIVSSASATTLEVKGVKQTGAVALKLTLKASTSTMQTDTSGFFANTCTVSTLEAKTSTVTGTVVTAPISSLSFSSCKEEPVVVDTAGTLSIENITGTTNGTVRWIGGKWTTPSPFGLLTCQTAASPGTDIGTMTGTALGNALVDLTATINCGTITEKISGTYTITSPEGLGVSA